ncbi:40-residue YVTN family beta-propeller repeat protein [Mycobacterium kansasii]|uniref:40-residue YVTN family beta-propeller repeat protein n=1 Tax=Mycobacterium kansasii TaxID=1768 RepID=A0A1V3XSJ6_MYCKA|nr:40-residue YVTN family beta-propeller repeat protein [Mycobacterium kansasii]
MSVIDGNTHTVTATVRVGHGPFGVAVDSETHTAYVTNAFGASVSLIDGNTHTVTATVHVGSARSELRWIRKLTPPTSPTAATTPCR